MARSTRAWGWHELDPRWAQRLVAESDLRPHALVLDVGAGRGAITAALLDADARVVAFELHRARHALLVERFGDTARIVRADVADLRLPRRPFHVVANPPFAVSSALLRRLLAPGSRLVSAHLVLQHQAAARWAGPGAPGAGRWSKRFRVELGRRLPRRAFSPPPRVDARLLHIRRR
ncbi:MAG: rRNA adenine N-6-methyltransferase family protein [Actinomycetota bacterium]